MKRKLFTPEQVIHILREAETSKLTVKELCRKYGIHEVTFYRWRKRYQGMTVSDAKRLKCLVDENAKLKKLLAERDLDADALKSVLAHLPWRAVPGKKG